MEDERRRFTRFPFTMKTELITGREVYKVEKIINLSVGGCLLPIEAEIDPDTPHPVIDILPEQRDILDKGGTMRLGAYEAHLEVGTLVHSLYQSPVVSERHRHRYEVNPEYHQIIEEKGMRFSGRSQDGRLVEFIELPDLKFFVATQAHPELKSRMELPAPLFYGFVKACLN